MIIGLGLLTKFEALMRKWIGCRWLIAMLVEAAMKVISYLRYFNFMSQSFLNNAKLFEVLLSRISSSMSS